MKNPVVRAWGCVGIMMLGVAIAMSSMAFLGNKTLLYLVLILGGATFLAGIILHYVFVRCPHCDSYLGRIYGPRCPFCGREYDKS
jgi:ABC-type maltose transport system permease subunit